ncbi:MAG TPA: GNAT family N-acetyltransferase [Elusimicrobiota bacterium]|jgi:GNAT superfamily N-acetyltransferase|nr:GNAT family N-acetyltransferase [Elusimicrobiota bacterium]
MPDRTEVPIFREAHPGEAPELARFQLELARETEGLALDPDACARGVRAVFDDPSKGRWYAASIGRDVAASLLVTPEWSDWFDGTIWWIQSVYVVPERRGRGLFSGLYGFVKALATLEPSVRGLRLYVDKRNLAAKRVYRTLGMNGDHYELFEWMKK